LTGIIIGRVTGAGGAAMVAEDVAFVSKPDRLLEVRDNLIVCKSLLVEVGHSQNVTECHCWNRFMPVIRERHEEDFCAVGGPVGLLDEVRGIGVVGYELGEESVGV
jgi:hypothetical protein